MASRPLLRDAAAPGRIDDRLRRAVCRSHGGRPQWPGRRNRSGCRCPGLRL